MHVTAIVLAAGKGARFKARIPKPLAKICLKPVIIYCLQVLSRHPLIKDIIVVANKNNKPGILSRIKQYRIKKVFRVVNGGRLRRDSVSKGLKSLAADTDLVLVHDGVRPFISGKEITALIKETRNCGAAVLAVPVKATIKKIISRRAGYAVKETLKRQGLWETQTPQAFKKELLLRAYRESGIKGGVTDDAMLVESLGKKISVVMGSYYNIKITTPEDLAVAEAIAQRHLSS